MIPLKKAYRMSLISAGSISLDSTFNSFLLLRYKCIHKVECLSYSGSNVCNDDLCRFTCENEKEGVVGSANFLKASMFKDICYQLSLKVYTTLKSAANK